MSNAKVLIIGGGLGGTALGQCLRNAGIDFHIYERDVSPQFRPQGWALTLRECLAGAYQLFPDDMPPLEESTSIFKDLPLSCHDVAGLLSDGGRTTIGARMYDTAELICEVPAATKDDLQHHWFRTNRAMFRQWLTTHLDCYMSWGKQFLRYEETADGVTAYFADGSVAHGTVLIACDGSRSRVRSQLLGEPSTKLEPASLGTITGEFQLPEAEYRDLLGKGSAFQVATSPLYHWFIGPAYFHADGTGEFFWAVTWTDAAHDMMREYSRDVNGSKARELALNLCHDLDPSLRHFIEMTRPEQVVTPGQQFWAWAPAVVPMPGTRVTLVGDSLHTMPPFKGAGANTALLDAYDLAQLLIRARDVGRDVANAVTAYERIAIPRGQAMVRFSKEAALSPDPTHWARVTSKAFAEGFEWKALDEARMDEELGIKIAA